MIAFIVPVRPLSRSSDPHGLKRALARTIRSVRSQQNLSWRLILVSHDTSTDFELNDVCHDSRISWHVVDFEFDSRVIIDRRYNGFAEDRLKGLRDKGRKAIWGTARTLELGAEYVMVLDCDDLVSCGLAEWCAENVHSPGWYIRKGWMWRDGARWVIQCLNDFNFVCGSSNIVNIKVFDDKALDKSYFDPRIEECGWWIPHSHIQTRISQMDHRFSALPFRGAVYVRHNANMSGVLNGGLRGFARTIIRTRLLTANVRKEFFGHS